MINKYKSLIIIAIVTALCVIIPLFVDLGSSIMNLLILLCVYIALSQSWNLLGGYTGLINLGLAAFFGCGVLITHLLWKSGVPIYTAMAASGSAAAILAGIIGLPTLRLRGVYFAIGTIALAEALRIVMGNVFPSALSLPAAFTANFNIFPRYYAALAVAAVTIAAVFFISRSKFGLGMICVREDEEAARVTGINSFNVKMNILVVSAFLAGLAGGAYAFNRFYFHHISAVFEPVWTFEPLMAVVIGGAGTVAGPIIGSIFLVVLSEVFALTMGDAHLIVFGVLFILVVLYSPSGLIGWINRLWLFLRQRIYAAGN